MISSRRNAYLIILETVVGPAKSIAGCSHKNIPGESCFSGRMTPSGDGVLAIKPGDLIVLMFYNGRSRSIIAVSWIFSNPFSAFDILGALCKSGRALRPPVHAHQGFNRLFVGTKGDIEQIAIRKVFQGKSMGVLPVIKHLSA